MPDIELDYHAAEPVPAEKILKHVALRGCSCPANSELARRRRQDEGLRLPCARRYFSLTFNLFTTSTQSSRTPISNLIHIDQEDILYKTSSSYSIAYMHGLRQSCSRKIQVRLLTAFYCWTPSIQSTAIQPPSICASSRAQFRCRSIS